MEIGPVGINEKQQIVVETKKQDREKVELVKNSGFNVTDSVEISLEAKKKIGELADRKRSEGVEITPNEPENNEEKLNIIKLRISNGFYSKAGIKEEIADRLIEDL